MPFTVLVYQDGVSLFSAEKPLYCFFRFLPLKLNRTQRNHVISIGGAQCHIQRNLSSWAVCFNGRTQLIEIFIKKLLPTVDPERLIGVRTPQLRSLAKELSGTPEAEDFLASLPHTYYDENTLHGLLISNGKDISWVIAQLDRFLPFVDNWATCDLTRPKIFQKHLPELLPKVKEWLASDHEYTVRFGIGMLLSFYLDRAFQPEYLTWVASLHRQEYYVNMMIAWYFATALAKQYEAALPYLQSHCLEQWTHNKAIQKALESTRIPPEHKEILRTLKRKQEKE